MVHCVRTPSRLRAGKSPPVRSHLSRRQMVPRAGAMRSAGRLLAGAGLLLVAAILLPGCGGEDNVSPPEGRLTGRVTIDLTEVPISEVQVRIADQEQLTGSDGTFRFSRLPQATHQLTAVKEGYRDWSISIQITESSVQNISLVPQDTIVNVSGKVRHRLDGPIADALVRLGSRSTITDVRGEFAFNDGRTFTAYAPEHEIDIVMTRTYRDSLQVQQDAEIRKDVEYADLNMGQATEMTLGRQRWILIKPPPLTVRPGSSIRHVTLRLHVQVDIELPLCFDVHAVAQAWDENLVSGNDSPDLGDLLLDFSGPGCHPGFPPPGGELDLDVLTFLLLLPPGEEHPGFCFRPREGGAEFRIPSSENADPRLRPDILVIYEY
jgi:hypothetical protein